eukprot:7667930-Alexandrium_andersonii.AAC.1
MGAQAAGSKPCYHTGRPGSGTSPHRRHPPRARGGDASSRRTGPATPQGCPGGGGRPIPQPDCPPSRTSPGPRRQA